MQELSREKLLLDLENRLDYFFDSKDIIILKKVIKFNLILLDNIEQYFLTSNSSEKISNNKEFNIALQIEENISRLGDLDLYGKSAKRTVAKIHTYLREKQRKFDKYYIFNKIIHLLIKYNNVNLDYISLDKINRLFQYIPEKMNKVFLSYAFEDRIYSLNLFCYFYSQEIYLYVDWIHNNKINNGIFLKSTLEEEIISSSQLLFLRTSNSELNIKGNKGIRPWCSWELGVFYEFGGESEKYLLNLYSIDNYDNLQFHGMKEVKMIENRRIIGKLITK